MKELILNLFLLLTILFVSIPSYAVDFIKFGTSHDENFWGTPNEDFGVFPSTIQFLAAKGRDQITSLDLTDENVEDVFNGDFGSFDAIVVSEEIETEEVLSPASYALFNQFVSAGGCLILTGDHADGEDEFLNNAFGYNVSVTDVQDVIDTFAIQPGSTPAFSDGPNTLVAADLTTAFSNTPGTVIYQGSEGVGVFTDAFGAGTVVAIGWDYCCTAQSEGGPGFNTPEQILAWYEVVNRAFSQCGFPEEIPPIPTLSEWGLIAMAGILGIFGLLFALRRRKAAA